VENPARTYFELSGTNMQANKLDQKQNPYDNFARDNILLKKILTKYFIEQTFAFV